MRLDNWIAIEHIRWTLKKSKKISITANFSLWTQKATTWFFFTIILIMAHQMSYHFTQIYDKWLILSNFDTAKWYNNQNVPIFYPKKTQNKNTNEANGINCDLWYDISNVWHDVFYFTTLEMWFWLVDLKQTVQLNWKYKKKTRWIRKKGKKMSMNVLGS